MFQSLTRKKKKRAHETLLYRLLARQANELVENLKLKQSKGKRKMDKKINMLNTYIKYQSVIDHFYKEFKFNFLTVSIGGKVQVHSHVPHFDGAHWTCDNNKKSTAKDVFPYRQDVAIAYIWKKSVNRVDNAENCMRDIKSLRKELKQKEAKRKATTNKVYEL